MEWVRWPVDDTDPHHLGALQEEVLKEERVRREEGGRGGALDLAMALADQRVLYGRLKMKPIYPELTEEEEVEEVKGGKGGGTKERGVEPVTVTEGDDAAAAAAVTKQAAVGGEAHPRWRWMWNYSPYLSVF